MNVLVDTDILKNFQPGQKIEKQPWIEQAKTILNQGIQDSRANTIPVLSEVLDVLKEDQSLFYNFLSIGYVTLDEKGIVKGANPAAVKMLGVEKSLLINADFINYIHKEDQKIFRLDGNCLSDLPHPFFDVRLKKRQGLFWSRVYVSINEYSQVCERQIRLILCDIKDLKRVEQEKIRLKRQLQQVQKMGTIGVLSSGIVHDFNSILHPIIGSLEILIEATARDSELQAALKNVFTSAKRADNLAQQILKFSHQADLRVSSVKIGPIIREVLQLIGSTLPANIKIIHTIDKGCGPVMADSTHIYQIVMKLITNAFHSMEHDEGILEVKLEEIEVTRDVPDGIILNPGTYACLSVANTGEGMDISTTSMISEPYFIFKEKKTRPILSDIFNIVKKVDGDICFSSEPGKGSLFQVYIPRGYVFFDTTQVTYDKK